MLVRELTELLRLICQTASAGDYEQTSEQHHRIILDTIERLGNKREGLRVVKCEERSLVSVDLSHADDSRGSKVFSGVCLCVCMSVRTITQKQSVQTWYMDWLWDILQVIGFLGEKTKIKVTGSQSAKRRSSGRSELCTLSSVYPLVAYAKIQFVRQANTWPLFIWPSFFRHQLRWWCSSVEEG